MIAIPPSVRAVLFDAVGTLLRPAPPVAAAYHAAGRRFGSKRDELEVQVRFRRAFQRQEEIDSQSETGATSEARELARWRTIVAETFDDVDRGEELFTALWEHFAWPKHWELFSDVAAAIQRVSRRGLLWGIASNFDGRLSRLCAGLPPLDTCRLVFASSSLGFRKPRAEFFRGIERQLRLRPDELLLVGDDHANDYAAAQAAGWHAVLLDRDGAQDRPGKMCIASLDELG